MDLAATPATSVDVARPPPPASAQHKYGTRTRQNSIMRPSARLRQSPDPPAPAPRKIKPAVVIKPVAPEDPPPAYPPFPPAHVMLHPDDSSSKVFLAIGRSLLSVGNRAVTIKDLAEMTVNFGLVCQNVSAASQAITTYIRNHIRRCEEEQDHPLLLRHVLSGTGSDDDLLPALHSRAGGAHCGPGLAENRLTNFRKGTMVWYLSKAAGAPCPFARMGIRICDYSETGKMSQAPPKDSRERRRERDRLRRASQCGQKRKRLARACADKGADSDSSSEEERPPPKVKLTLRLKPSLAVTGGRTPSSSPVTMFQVASSSTGAVDFSQDSDSDDDSMSVVSSDSGQPAETSWALPPYPSRAVSIPIYTPSLDGPHPRFPSPMPQDVEAKDEFRRSPSVPHSVASAPPDSEDEDEDYHITMTGTRRASGDRLPTPFLEDAEDDKDWPFDFDGQTDRDGDDEISDTQWGDSPGPTSPPPVVAATVPVKEEANDVRDLLERWEDLDQRGEGGFSTVAEVVARAAADPLDIDLGRDFGERHDLDPSSDMYAWANYGGASPDWNADADEDDVVAVKQEWASDKEMSPDSAFGSGPEEPRAIPSPLTSFMGLSLRSPVLERGETSFVAGRRPSELTWKDVELLGPDSVHPHDFEDGEWQKSSAWAQRSVQDAPLGRAESTPVAMDAASPEQVSASQSDVCTSEVEMDKPSSAASTPALSDSASSGSPDLAAPFSPLTASPFPPLGAAPVIARKDDASEPSIGSVVTHAESREDHTLDLGSSNKRDSQTSIKTAIPDILDANPWDSDMYSHAEDPMVYAPPIPMGLHFVNRPLVPEDMMVAETPLTPTEQEMFRSLCNLPDENVPQTVIAPGKDRKVPAEDTVMEAEPAEDVQPTPDRQLRRSTRLATGAAPAAARTRSGARNAANKRSSR